VCQLPLFFAFVDCHGIQWAVYNVAEVAGKDYPIQRKHVAAMADNKRVAVLQNSADCAAVSAY
jgi:hypothetical protein